MEVVSHRFHGFTKILHGVIQWNKKPRMHEYLLNYLVKIRAFVAILKKYSQSSEKSVRSVGTISSVPHLTLSFITHLSNLHFSGKSLLQTGKAE